MNKDKLLDYLGWIGTALIIGGYGLFAMRIIPEILWSILNLVGSCGVLAISAYRKIWQPVVINGFMMIFAAIAIATSIFK